MATAIKVENLTKIYRLGEIGTGTISRDVERFVKTKILKQEDPFLKIGEANDRATKGESDIVYSLKDINFEIEQGDAVGIIGRNGAGKSTLLKILSRVTSPTTGKINIKGRVASLLEVGTGFHPELTGRENIYLNGAILGMRKKEIDRKFDEIVDFSGVERYIDTPVKRYSSGMYVRLAFAVAAHLESEILIVDEVLAVGDAEFQKKCLGKLGEVSKGEGRTVLFVSHNLLAVENLCSKGILLHDGYVLNYDTTMKIIDLYKGNNIINNIPFSPNYNNHVYLKGIRIHNGNFGTIKTGGSIFFELVIFSKTHITGIVLGIGINDSIGQRICTPYSRHLDKYFDLCEGENNIKLELPNFPLKPAKYGCEIYIGTVYGKIDYYDKELSFLVDSAESKVSKLLPESSQGIIIINQIWN